MERLSQFRAWWSVDTIMKRLGVDMADPKAPDIFAPYATDLAEAGERSFCIYDTGPNLDAFIDVARSHGFTDAKEAPPALWEKLHNSGFKNIYIHSVDEIPLDLHDNEVLEIHERARHDPDYVKREAYLDPVSANLVRAITPGIWEWNVFPSSIADMLAWRVAGEIAIPDGHGIGFYYCKEDPKVMPYTRGLHLGWLAGYHNLSHWTLVSYMGAIWNAVTPTMDGPVPTDAWRGIKAGNRAYRMLRRVHATEPDAIPDIFGDLDMAQCPYTVDGDVRPYEQAQKRLER